MLLAWPISRQCQVEDWLGRVGRRELALVLPIMICLAAVVAAVTLLCLALQPWRGICYNILVPMLVFLHLSIGLFLF